MSASDACDAAFLAVDPYTTRASYLLEMSKAERERERYNRPLDSEDYLDTHTAAIGTVTSAFNALTTAFAALSSGDGLYPSLVGIYEGTSAICRLTAQAYHYAALDAAIDAARGVLQARKDGVDASMLEAKASNPSTTNPDAVRAEAAAAKAKADDDSIKANVLKQKAEAAKSTAQILLAKAKAAEAKAEEALKVRQ